MARKIKPIALFLCCLAILPVFFTKPVKATRCTRVVQSANSEYIINTCSACRKVNIRRKRRGIAMPVMRTYNIQPRSKFPTSFKGVGRSRISSEVPCEGTKGAGVNMMNPKASPKPLDKCVTLRAIGSRDVALINKCSSCRGVAVQRYARTGRPLGQQVYKMKPLSILSVESKGAAKVSYIADVPCPS